MAKKSPLVAMVVAGLVSLHASPGRAAVKQHDLIADNMVLQQGMQVPLWGSADVGEQVTVQFQDQEVTTTAKDGKWLVRLDKLKAGGPFEMTIRATNTIHLKNVLVGEVWICSGQSNMEMSVQATHDAGKTIANSANPMIRLFTVAKRPASAPLADVKGDWAECGPKTVPGFTAVGYFFGRDLEKALQVPVGLIHTSWGGTPAEAWTSRQALETEPALKYMADNQARPLRDYPKALDHFSEELAR